jgi:predicted porin
MKRSLIVAALAATAATSALAQSNVTIYGRLNTSIERLKDGNVSRTDMLNNSSRIGFKGTEDLGGGLKAMFVIEHGFDSSTGAGAGTMWGREATVGLSGNFGTVRLGNMPASEGYFATADYVSMHNHDTGTSSDAFYAGSALICGLSNTIAYTSPTFSGVSVAVQKRVKETGNVDPLSLAANYDAGPLHLGFGYEECNGAKSTAVRGLYEMGALTVGGYIEKNSGNNTGRTNLRLAAMYTMGAGEFHANLGLAGKIDGVDDTDAKQFTLGYNYNLSKRTKVYGFYTKVDNSANVNYYSSANGSDFSSLAVGVRHNF